MDPYHSISSLFVVGVKLPYLSKQVGRARTSEKCWIVIGKQTRERGVAQQSRHSHEHLFRGELSAGKNNLIAKIDRLALRVEETAFNDFRAVSNFREGKQGQL